MLNTQYNCTPTSENKWIVNIFSKGLGPSLETWVLPETHSFFAGQPGGNSANIFKFDGLEWSASRLL